MTQLPDDLTAEARRERECGALAERARIVDEIRAFAKESRTDVSLDVGYAIREFRRRLLDRITAPLERGE